MTLYYYKAVDANGKRVRGQLDATTVQDLESRLDRMNLSLISQKDGKSVKSFAVTKARVNRKDVIGFTFHMEQLTKAGVPIMEALVDLRDSLPPGTRMREVCSGLVDDIEGGKSFSGAMENYPDTFSDIYQATIKVGEESGQLSNILHELGEMIKWQDELASHAKKIAIYPAIVITVGLAVTVFLMMFLVPQLTEFLLNSGSEIPIQTTALIKTSDFFVNYWYIIFPTPILTFIFLHVGAKTSHAIRLKVDGATLKIPILGPIIEKLKIARFTAYFALMYGSGITVLDSIRFCRRIVDNAVIEQALEKAELQISEGESISNSFANAALFPPFVVRMFKVGETSGALDEALLNVSYFYDREVKESINKIEPAISPILTVMLGLLMAWIMFAVLSPIYDVISDIGV